MLLCVFRFFAAEKEPETDKACLVKATKSRKNRKKVNFCD